MSGTTQQKKTGSRKSCYKKGNELVEQNEHAQDKKDIS